MIYSLPTSADIYFCRTNVWQRLRGARAARTDAKVNTRRQAHQLARRLDRAAVGVKEEYL